MTFDPDRWDDEKRHSTLLTFGMGTRACFGRRLANTEIKLYLFSLLQRYNVVAANPDELKAEFNFGNREMSIKIDIGRTKAKRRNEILFEYYRRINCFEM